VRGQLPNTFSSDGRRIALLDGRGVQVHDLTTGQRAVNLEAVDVACEPTRLASHNEPLAFAPDGKTLATGHRDGTVTVWKVPPVPHSAAVAPADRDGAWADLSSPKAVTGRAAVE